MATYYPPVSFYFTVNIAGVGTEADSSFQEISGLHAERGVLELNEGGENRFAWRLPERAKFENLVLRRGMMPSNSGLASWCKTVIESDLQVPISTNTVVVSLLNASAEPLMVWNFVGAWPVKWSASDLSAERNELAIETLELAYSYYTKSPGSGASQAS
jgi:phage tail-like protein